MNENSEYFFESEAALVETAAGSLTAGRDHSGATRRDLRALEARHAKTLAYLTASSDNLRSLSTR